MEALLINKSFIESELKKYNIADAYIAELSDHHMSLKVDGVNDIAGYKVARRARIEIKGKRVEVEKKRKDLKTDSVKFGKAIDTEARRIISLLLPIEEHLISQEKIVDDEKERIENEKEIQEKERIEREEAERKREEEERQTKIREEQKIESERLEKIRTEQEEKQAKIKSEQDKIDADKRAISKHESEKERQAEIERAKEESAKQARIDAEDKAQRELEEKEKVEKQAKKDEILRLALMPDNEKLATYAKAIRAIPMPSLANKQSHKIFDEAIGYLKKAYKILMEEKE